jgi:hypothetical protein
MYGSIQNYYGGNIEGMQNTIAGNPAEFLIPGRARRTTQPKLPGEDPRAIEGVYGSPSRTPIPVPGQPALPQAFNFPAVGNMGALAQAAFNTQSQATKLSSQDLSKFEDILNQLNTSKIRKAPPMSFSEDPRIPAPFR